MSISVPFVSVKRVGRVIWGFRLFDIKRSKKSQYIEFAFSFSRLILVSPTNAMLWFCDIMVSIMGVNSSINCLRIWFDLGGRYKLKIVSGFGKPLPEIFTVIPSQCWYMLKFILVSKVNLLSMYNSKPPLLLHDFPCETQLYPSIWNGDKSSFSDNQVSCRHITLYLKFILCNSTI